MRYCISLAIVLFTSGIVTGQSNENFLRDFTEKWQNSKKYTLDVLELMPADDYEFKPSEEEMSFKKLSIHVLQNMIWLSSDYLGGDGFENDLKTIDPTKEELVKITESAYDYTLKTLEKLGPQRLETKVEFFAGPMNIRKILMLMDDHATHHRAQLAVYLRIKGIKPPRYVGW